MKTLFLLFATFLAGCASMTANLCPAQEGHVPEILNTSIKTVETQGVSGHKAQEFSIEVLTFNQSTNVVLYVNGQRQGLFAAAGAFIGPKSYIQRDWTQQEINACQGKVLGTVFVMKIGAVGVDYPTAQPLAQELHSGQSISLRVDVCNDEFCTHGQEKTLIVE